MVDEPYQESFMIKQRKFSEIFKPISILYVRLLKIFKYHYHFVNGREFANEIKNRMKNHKGPLLIVGNHLTMIDSVLHMYPLGWRKIFPWHVPDKDNFNPDNFSGGKRLWWKFFYKAFKTIPVDRKGKTPEAELQREATYQKMLWVLERGEALFVFPELTRSRQGWFERNNIKDFVGRILLANPGLPVLAIYGRGENQQSYSASPQKGERIRLFASYFVPAISEKRNSGATIELAGQVFDTIANLQDKWFYQAKKDGLKIKRCCSGNDVVDLSSTSIRKRFYNKEGDLEIDTEYIESILNEEELVKFHKNEKNRFLTFWKMFSAKEAAYKALAQADIYTEDGAKGYRSLKINLRKHFATFEPYGARVAIRFVVEDDYLHCLAVYRGGWVGNKFENGDIIEKVESLPAGVDKWEYKREILKDLLIAAYPQLTHSKLDVRYENDIPVVYHGDELLDIGLSFSDCGKYVAVSFIHVPFKFLSVNSKENRRKVLA